MFSALFRKELRCLFRSRRWPAAVCLFSFVLVVLASFAFRRIGYGQTELRELTPGIIWIIFLFCGIVSLNYSFLAEEELGGLTGLLLTPCDPALIYLAKFVTNWLFLLALQLAVILAHALLFGVELGDRFPLLASITALVSFGFTALGTLLAAVGVAVRGRELILPLLLFPLSLPQLAAGVFLTAGALEQGGAGLDPFWLLLAAGFDVISFAVSLVLFEFVVKD